MGGKSGGAEWEFETYLIEFETYSVLRDYETKKTTDAAAPAAPASLAPMHINVIEFGLWSCGLCQRILKSCPILRNIRKICMFWSGYSDDLFLQFTFTDL